MSDTLVNAVLITWRRNGAYALRMVERLSAEQFTAQPTPAHAMNHPAWILSHLNVYAAIAAAMLRRQSFDDPADHPFGPKSEIGSPSAYAPAPALIAEYQRLHDDAEQALAGSGAGTLALTNPLERWRPINPTVGDMVVTLMIKHESFHLGQLSAWRRAMGFQRVAM